MATLAQTLEDLIKQYNQPAYQKKTADQIRTQAEGEYQSYYDQLRRAAQFQQERSDLALQQQRDALQQTYDKQREASMKNYALRYSQADRQMLSRGMQRSSYAAQTLANIDLEGAEAQNDLWEAQAAAEGNIDAQRTQLAEQLAAQLMGYDADQAADVMNRIRQIEDQEYERGVTDQANRNQLSAQIYQFMYQAERDKVADQQWQAQFDESVRQFNETHKKSSGGGGGGKKKTSTTNPTTNPPAGPNDKAFNDELNDTKTPSSSDGKIGLTISSTPGFNVQTVYTGKNDVDKTASNSYVNPVKAAATNPTLLTKRTQSTK